MKIQPAWYFDLANIEFTHHKIEIRGLDDAFAGYRLVQISDFHLGSWFKLDHLEKIVNAVNELNPDLIAITGDLVSRLDQKIFSGMTSTLRKLKPRDATVAILGNHDHWTDARMIRDALEQSHVIDLSNSVIPIERDGAKIFIAGVDDILSGYDDLGKVLPQINNGHPAILLAHEPDFIEVSSATRKFTLQLSGHTHGGQIIFPLLGPLYLPQYGRKYPRGMHRVGEMLLYTNRGLGTSWLGLRMNCPPEITIFSLQPEAIRPASQ